MDLPSTIVARFPLQGRSAVSKAPSGIWPSGLKISANFNPRNLHRESNYSFKQSYYIFLVHFKIQEILSDLSLSHKYHQHLKPDIEKGQKKIS